MQIKQDLLDQVLGTFWSQGVRQVDGIYDGIAGAITFHFLDGDVLTGMFEYDALQAGLDSVTGFKELLYITGGTIIQRYNSKYPKDMDYFINAVTEQ